LLLLPPLADAPVLQREFLLLRYALLLLRLLLQLLTLLLHLLATQLPFIPLILQHPVLLLLLLLLLLRRQRQRLLLSIPRVSICHPGCCLLLLA
jgi:hypothetical protein